MRYKSLNRYLQRQKLPTEECIFVLAYILEELESMHAAGKYQGNLSCNTVLYSPYRGISFAAPYHNSTGSLPIKQAEDISAVGRVAIEIVSRSSLEGVAMLDILVDPAGFLASKDITDRMPVWFSLLLKRMLEAEIKPISAKECKEAFMRNMKGMGPANKLNPGCRVLRSESFGQLPIAAMGRGRRYIDFIRLPFSLFPRP